VGPKACQEATRPDRWDLLIALVPYFGETPYRLQEISRATDREHTKIDYQVAEYEHHRNLSKTRTTSGGIPGPQYMFSGKVRPVLVVGHVHQCLSGKERDPQNGKQNQRSPWPHTTERKQTETGVDGPYLSSTESAALTTPIFLGPPSTRIALAKGGNCTSILRLDHVFPLNRPSREEDPSKVFQPNGVGPYIRTPRGVMEDWLGWLLKVVTCLNNCCMCSSRSSPKRIGTLLRRR